MPSAMGLQSLVTAHPVSPPAIPSSQISWHGFTETPTRLCLEKLQFASRGQLVRTFTLQIKHGNSSGLAVAHASQQAIDVAFEGVQAAGTVNVNATVQNSGEVPLIQLNSSEPSLSQLEREAPSDIQGVPSLMESPTEPSSSAATDLNVVPGETTLLINEIPASPDSSLTNQSTDLESIRSSAEASVNATVDSSQEAANVAKESLLTDQSMSAKEAYEALLSGSRPSVETDSAVDTLSQASKSISDAFVEAKSVLVNAITNIQDSFQDSVDNAGSSFRSTYDKINGSIVNTMNNISGSYEKPVTVMESGAGKGTIYKQLNPLDVLTSPQLNPLDVLTSPFRMGTPVNDTLKGVVTTVKSATGTAFVAIGRLIADGYTATKEVLPIDVRLFLDSTENKLSESAGPIQYALQQVYSVILDAERAVGIDPQNPIIPVILVIGGTVFLGILYRQSVYGGYSGDLAPASVLDILRKDGNIVLVDIRPEDLRESEGIPDLRRQARFKFASVEAMKMQGSLQKLLKNVDDADAIITATIIKNLKLVQPNTKVIIMDADGSKSKSVARALKKAGIKIPYRIDGGFRSWKADGLRVKQIGPETPLIIIKEEAEAILEEVKPTPGGLAAVTLGFFAGIYALTEWEKTLQLLGLICISQVLYSRFSSYGSVDDLKADLRVLLSPFALATQGIVWMAGKLEPSKLQLATSPSTSAVQDRVLQAAAKHGPLPSELDQQQEAQPLEELAEGMDVTSTEE